MRKRVFGRHLKRDTNERKALFKNLLTELVLREKITTTEEKAKAIRAQAEKLITKAKRKGAQAEYLLQPYVSAEAVKKLMSDLSSRFASRPGGYTRLTKLGNRFGDNASMVVIELVDQASALVKVDKKIVQEEIAEALPEATEIQEAEIVIEEPKKEKKVSKKVKEEKQIERKPRVKKEKS